MKIAVSSLLLLATLVECRFMTRSSMRRFGTNSFHGRMLDSPEVSPDICNDLERTNRKAFKACKLLTNDGTVTCSFVFKLLTNAYKPIAVASKHLFDKVCRTPEDALLPEDTTPAPVVTTRKRATSTPVYVTPPTDFTCGQSPKLRKREPFMNIGAGLGRIVGGEDTKGCSMVPWQVQVNADFGLCGGAIISRNHVLTAAHCLRRVNYTPKYLEVKVADYELYGSDQKVYSVKRVDAHERYTNYSKMYDIAVLTLNESLTFSDCVTPICLDPSFVPNGGYCVVSGWGHTRFGGPSSAVLKMLRVKTYKGSDCKEAFGSGDLYMTDEPAQVCAGYIKGGAGTCQGDSGGPLVCWHNGRYVQTGIVSYALGCAWANSPTAFTNVPYYYNWIMNKIMNKS